jgi:hypothetical protein
LIFDRVAAMIAPARQTADGKSFGAWGGDAAAMQTTKIWTVGQSEIAIRATANRMELAS